MTDLPVWLLLGMLVGGCAGWAYTRPSEVADGFHDIWLALVGLPAYVRHIWQRGW